MVLYKHTSRESIIEISKVLLKRISNPNIKSSYGKGRKKMARDKNIELKKGSSSFKKPENKGKFSSCSICKRNHYPNIYIYIYIYKRNNHLEMDHWHKDKPQMKCHFCPPKKIVMLRSFVGWNKAKTPRILRETRKCFWKQRFWW